MGRIGFSRPFRYWLRDSGFLVRFFLGNANAGGSAICIHKDLLPGDAVVTHVITCRGRDHVVNVQSGCQSLVIVNVPFEPELTQRSLRKRLRFIEGRFDVWNQTFTDGDKGKAALFHSLFPRVLEIAQPDYTRRDSSVNGVKRTLSRIERAFINIPVAEARDFHCYSHVFENLEKRSIPSNHAAVRVVIQKPTIGRHEGKRIPS